MPATPPIWLDEFRRRVPTRTCWSCGREQPVYRFRPADLARHGWQPAQTCTIMSWCGHSQELLPWPAGRGWLRLVPVWDPLASPANPLTRHAAGAMTTAEALEAFVTAHQPHGPIRGDCSEATERGYLAWAACGGCGGTWARWVTLGIQWLRRLLTCYL